MLLAHNDVRPGDTGDTMEETNTMGLMRLYLRLLRVKGVGARDTMLVVVCGGAFA